ncbi:hypothetical protein ZWY2020_009953 [Hordeum vulgare]|nr:hypothetical protein ZWY2020_009953 [Hordeum vulgare]
MASYEDERAAVASARASPSGRGPAPLPTCASTAHQRRRLSPSPPPRKRPAPPLLASPPWRRPAVAAHLRSHHGHTLAMLTSAAATVSHLLLPPVAASHLRRRFGRAQLAHGDLDFFFCRRLLPLVVVGDASASASSPRRPLLVLIPNAGLCCCFPRPASVAY